DRYRSAYLRLLQLLILLIAPGILWFLFTGTEVASFLLGPRWIGIGPVMSWLCLGGIASLVYSTTFWLFVSQGRAKEQLRYGWITCAISIIGFASGLPWGPVGVAAGAGISFAFVSTPLTCWG